MTEGAAPSDVAAQLRNVGGKGIDWAPGRNWGAPPARRGLNI